MRKIQHSFRILLTALVVLLSVSWAHAQQPFDPMEIVPSDTSVRYGVLPGGSTYYIKHNAKPANRANFHIYYKVGAVQEEEHQNGLAHFLEHMAFNGSKHFKDNAMVDYLSTIGVRHGENLNAGTGQEMTSYMITNVPLLRESIVDSVLLILHDWAGFIALEEEDIDKERGVILEEWRQGNSANRRIMEKQFPVLFANSIYAKRNIIGKPELLESFSYQAIRDFYHKWYRPDLQAFVIVGDFDVDVMEKKLKEVMSDIVPFDVRTPKEEVVLADNAEPLISIESDPELTGTTVQLLFRHPPVPDQFRNRMIAYKKGYIEDLASQILGERFSEIALKEDAPFLGASGSYSSFIRPADIFFAGASARDGEALRTLEAVYTELVKMQKGGFTQSELDRAKTNTLRTTERHYENRNDRTNGEFIGAFYSHFEDGTPYITPETDKVVTEHVLANITLDEVNEMVKHWVQDRNSAILISMPAKDGIALPTKEEVLSTIQKAKSTEVEAQEDLLAGVPLMDASGLKGSKVVKTSEGEFGSTVLMLKNGVRVIVKPTEYKADEILVQANQNGGTSTLTDMEDLYNASMLGAFVGRAGLAEFSVTDLGKLLTGKIAGVSPFLSSYTQGFSGSCSPKDLETLMQMVYLRYTAPRFEQSDWNVLMNLYQSQKENTVKNPNYIFQKNLTRTLYGNNPRTFDVFDDGVLETVSLEGVEKLYRQFFSNADEMTFYFVGNISVADLQPLAEKYLGSLPSKKHTAAWGPERVLPVTGIVENEYATKLETPKVTVMRVYTGTAPYTLERELEVGAIRYMLEMRYTKSIREEKGGTYGVGVGGSFSKLPEPRFTFSMSFDTDTTKVDELLPVIQEEIDDLMANGATAEELTKTKEFFVKRYRDGLIHNASWLSYLMGYYWSDVNSYEGYEERVAALTPDSIRQAARELFGQGNVVTVIQLPE